MPPSIRNARGERILVIANETVESHALRETITSLVDGAGGARVAIVAPALNSRLRHWLSDEDRARSAAYKRLRRFVESLTQSGVDVVGWVGDADPMQAIADALPVFPADRLIIATHPETRSNWLARHLVERAGRRFCLPVTHIIAHGIGDEHRAVPSARSQATAWRAAA